LKKILIVLAILNILIGILGFFTLLGTNIIYALISLGGGIIGSVPYFALVGAMEDIEVLHEEQQKLKGQLHKITDQIDDQTQSDKTLPPSPNEISRRVWECVKCKTINKDGTSCCSHCGAKYSSWINP
jgi:hypothetical protein